MNCEDFVLYGIGVEHDAQATDSQIAAVREHSLLCPDCAALARSWESAREKLDVLADVTHVEGAPARVEMRLRQEFRTRHISLKTRRAATVAGWALAAAALVVGAISWTNGHRHQLALQQGSVQTAQVQSNAAAPASNGSDDRLVADNNQGDEFTPIPGAIYAGGDDSEIMHVRIQRSSLGALGFPVNEERANDWIQVDLLVGNDGVPQAVRAAE
jgi:hypothetical protein